MFHRVPCIAFQPERSAHVLAAQRNRWETVKLTLSAHAVARLRFATHMETAILTILDSLRAVVLQRSGCRSDGAGGTEMVAGGAEPHLQAASHPTILQEPACTSLPLGAF